MVQRVKCIYGNMPIDEWNNKLYVENLIHSWFSNFRRPIKQDCFSAEIHENTLSFTPRNMNTCSYLSTPPPICCVNLSADDLFTVCNMYVLYAVIAV